MTDRQMAIVFLILQLILYFLLRKQLKEQRNDQRKEWWQIMSAVEAQQEDIDALAESFEGLVTVVSEIDTTKLPAADLSKLNTALSDVAGAINSKLPVASPVTDPGTDVPPVDGA